MGMIDHSQLKDGVPLAALQNLPKNLNLSIFFKL
jgi:hypothetical protein